MRRSKQDPAIASFVNRVLQLETEITVLLFGTQPGPCFLRVGRPILAVAPDQNSILNGPFAALDLRPAVQVAAGKNRFATLLLVSNVFRRFEWRECIEPRPLVSPLTIRRPRNHDTQHLEQYASCERNPFPQQVPLEKFLRLSR